MTLLRQLSLALFRCSYRFIHNRKRNSICIASSDSKISSNSKLAGHKDNWIDFNAGRLVEDMPMEMLSKELFEYVLAVASGKKVKAEEAGFHDMAIFKQGVTL